MFRMILKMEVMKKTGVNNTEGCYCYFSQPPYVLVRISGGLSAAPAHLLELPVGNLYGNDPVQTQNDFPSTSPAN